MEYRSGKCSSCGAEYKIPASFAHDVARCKECKGVVHLAAAGDPSAASQQPAPPPAPPARKPAPAPAPKPKERTAAPAAAQASEPVEVSRERKGGNTLERLKAERRTAAAQASESTAPKTPARSAPTPARRTAPAAKVAPTPAKVAGAPTKAAGAKGTPAAKTTRAGSSRSARGAARREKPKKSAAVPLIGFIGLIAIAAGAFFLKDTLFGSDDTEVVAPTADATDEPLNEIDATDGSGSSAANGAGTAEGTTGADLAAAGAMSAVDGAAAGESTSTAPSVDETGAPDPFAEPVAAAPAKPKADPDSVDLTAIADFERVPNTTDEEWEGMQEWVALWMDPDAGARGNRAKNKLIDKGRLAMPIILNRLKAMDFSTELGKSNGDQCQRAMMEICNGNNFGWKYTTEPNDVYFNKKAAKGWCTQYGRTVGDLEYWIRLANLDQKKPDEAKRLRAAAGVGTDDEGDDDLDVD